METLRSTRLRPTLLALAVIGLLLYLARPSQTQQQGGGEIPKRDVGKTSYDQIAPVLMGQETFEAMLAKDKAGKAAVMTRQQALLEERYDLKRRVDESARKGDVGRALGFCTRTGILIGE